MGFDCVRRIFGYQDALRRLNFYNFSNSMKKRFILEVCVDSVESAIATQDGGADRVELCTNLLEHGTTPSAGMIELAREHLRIDLHAIIRPRGGDFCYSEIEFEIMKRDVIVAKKLGVDGVVLGILKPDRSVDVERTRRLVDLARPCSVTFHRAFDVTADPLQALDDVIVLGIDRLLTSGQAQTAIDGLPLITRLVQKAAGRITIMPAGGINAQNIHQIIAQSGVPEIHAGSAVSVKQKDSASEMFAAWRRIVDAYKVRELLQRL